MKTTEASKQTIIDFLLDGWGIKLNDDSTNKNYSELICAGYANYSDGIMSKNWKTEYYRETVPEPIESRFEIMDL
jgi:hypothetical protein